ncbi:MAG TPA: glycine oxidase ThiO [Rhizomicrobium sp.]|nr:glycine oxidase ThiO [Rhizomicrobium sp.]
MKVVIIGAGVAGLGLGWRLRQAGAEVTILERSQPAQGATWAAAGMIAVAGELGGAQTVEGEFARHSSCLWPGFASELEAASGQAIFYRRSGALLVARTPAEAAAFETWSGVDRLNPAQALEKEPMLTPDIAGALWASDEAQVDSRALGQALAAAFVRAGGTLSVNEPAIRFEVRGDEAVALHTPFGRYEADAFVIAAGAWSGELGGLPPDALPPVRPVKGEMIAVAPPAGTALPSHVVWGNGVYLVPRAGRLLVGATVAEVGFDTAVTDAAAGWLSRRAIALMPALASWEVVERWAGLRPGSPDGQPILGRTKIGRLFAATGQYRNGILFAPAVAETMSRLVLEHAAEIPAFDPRRFP